MLTDIIVLKFGSSVLRGRADLPSAVHEIYRLVPHAERGSHGRNARDLHRMRAVKGGNLPARSSW